MKVEHNIARLNYLLTLFKMTVDEMLVIASKGLTKPLLKEDLFGNEINLSHLKRIDKIFNKGLNFYLDPKNPEVTQDASIFFRKQKFGTELSIGTKKIVNQFEELKISLSAISKLANLEMSRNINVFSVNDDAKFVATEIRKILYPEFIIDKKDFLKALINKFAEKNILVFEFVETWNKKETANIDGFFLNPNVIVLKRQQNSFRREIFTLIHELGHFLLNEEEIDLLDYQNLAKDNLSSIERWCNDFAYHFLIGEYGTLIDNIKKVDETNDYCFSIIEEVSKKTHLSQIALFTRLLFQNKVSKSTYNKIKSDFDEKYKAREEETKRLRELEKQNGKKPGGSTPKPINSPLFVSTIQTAYYEGIINEYEVCKKLNIKPESLDKYIQ